MNCTMRLTVNLSRPSIKLEAGTKQTAIHSGTPGVASIGNYAIPKLFLCFNEYNCIRAQSQYDKRDRYRRND
jgi:hypothetical protein